VIVDGVMKIGPGAPVTVAASGVDSGGDAPSPQKTAPDGTVLARK
jgi:hypothetical protein